MATRGYDELAIDEPLRPVDTPVPIHIADDGRSRFLVVASAGSLAHRATAACETTYAIRVIGPDPDLAAIARSALALIALYRSGMVTGRTMTLTIVETTQELR